MPAVPYFAQFESRELIPEFLSGKRDPADDPLWHLSGASDSHEYAKWCSHICGMACLKMLLAHWQERVIPTIALAKQCRDYKALRKGRQEVTERTARRRKKCIRHAQTAGIDLRRTFRSASKSLVHLPNLALTSSKNARTAGAK